MDAAKILIVEDNTFRRIDVNGGMSELKKNLDEIFVSHSGGSAPRPA